MTFEWATRSWHYRDLVRNLVGKDFKVRYQGSILGFLWTLVTPLALILIYVVAFQYVLRINIDNFALFLITGILPWTFFSTALITSAEAIVGNGSLLKSIYFPREALVLANVIFHFLHLLLAMAVFLPVMLFLGAPVTPSFIVLPLILAINFLLVVGFSLLIASITVYFVDIRQIVDLTLMALFWLTPIIYNIDSVPERLRQPLLLGPMAAIVNGYQDVVYWGRWPSLDTWLVGGGWAVAAFVFGLLVFRWLQPRFAEVL